MRQTAKHMFIVGGGVGFGFVAGMSALKTTGSIMGAIALIVMLTFVACTSDAQRIREANEAARLTQTETPSDSESTRLSTPTPRSGDISIFDIRDGDCLVTTLPDVGEMGRIEIVPCTESWESRVLSSFVVESIATFPGNEFFSQPALNRCDRRYSFLMFPTKESWAAGDRTVICLQRSYGLSGTDIDKLDRMVNLATLRDGECINSLPETQFELVELVDCLGDWEIRILNSFELTADGPFPGDDYIDIQASSRCAREYNYIVPPTAETWLQGDRVVICGISR